MRFLSFPAIASDKMFQSNFDDFSRRRTTGASKVKNDPQINQFCTRTIATLFGVQFLSFSVNMAENCFRRTLITFSGSNPTRADKFQNRARMTLFYTRNVATRFGMQFLSFPAVASGKMFRSNFDDFSMPGHHRSRQTWKRARMT